MRFLDLFPAPEDHEAVVDELCQHACENDGLIDVRAWLIDSWLIGTDPSVFALLGTWPEDPTLLEDVEPYSLHTSSETKCIYRSHSREEPDEYSTYIESSAHGPDGELASESGEEEAGSEGVCVCVTAIVRDIVRRACENA